MKKFRNSAVLAMLAITAGSLSGCGSKSEGILFWSSFGSSYTGVLDNITASVGDKIGSKITHHSCGSYDKVKEDMMSSIATGDYPNLVTGYPDHFAEYIGNDILIPLDEYIKEYDKKHGTDLLNDYLEAYMEENFNLDVDDNGNKILSALPFNKSTELMGYNGTFVDYCVDWCIKNSHVDWDLGKVPATWQEWEVKGPHYRTILDELCKLDADHPGKAVYGVQDYQGNASDFEVSARVDKKDSDGNFINNSGKKMLLDFTDVDINMSRVISWDSTDNMFITLVRQWGSEYTELPDDQKLEEPLYRKGNILFYSAKNKQKTIDCLSFFNKLHTKGIFGVPQEFNGSYNSDAFEHNQVMFMLCSSGGLSYNTAKWEYRFRVAPLPYYNDGQVSRKFVISQGANITLTDRTENYDECFDAMVALTTGEYQAEWCLQTGYYPCSKSATNDPKYQSFLHEADDNKIQEYANNNGVSLDEARAHAYSVPTRVAYREGSNVNETEYMVKEKGWTKFVDDAFIGSSDIRTLVKDVFKKVFTNVKLDTEGNPLGSNKMTYDSILKDVVTSPTIAQKKQNINVVY